MSIKICRRIDFGFLRRIDFPYLERFDEFGWTKFFKILTPAPPTIVRAFFSNAELQYDPNDRCKIVGFDTFVLGKKISVNTDSLTNYLGLRNEGLVKESERVPSEFNVDRNRAGDLPMFPRILHLIISWNIRPLGSKHAQVRDLERFWMHHIHTTGQKPNLVHFIFDDWVRIIEGKVHSIVFPQIVAFILLKVGLNLSCEKGKEPSPNNDINLTCLHNVGWYKDELIGQWVKRRGAPPPPAAAQDEAQAQENAPAATGQAVTLETLMAEFTSRFDSLDSRFNAFESRLSHMEQRQTAIYDEVQAIRAQLDEEDDMSDDF